MEFDHEIFSTDFLLLALIQEGLLSEICTEYLFTTLAKLAQEKCG